MSMKNSNDTIGNRSRDLLVCNAVPQLLRHRVLIFFLSSTYINSFPLASLLLILLLCHFPSENIMLNSVTSIPIQMGLVVKIGLGTGFFFSLFVYLPLTICHLERLLSVALYKLQINE
jgi:hypothetical protein